MGPAVAVPAAVSVGTGLMGKSSAKKAQKRQEDMARQQMAAQAPLIAAQTEAAQYGLNQAKQYNTGAQQAIGDVKNWWAPIMSGDRTAIDQFLSPERGAINQGYQSASQNMATFGPRGGGRASAMMNADLQRQGQLSNLVFGARRQGVDAMSQLGQLQGQLGNQMMGLGTNAAGVGSNAISASYKPMMDVMANDKTGGILAGTGQQLGGLMNDFFKGKQGMSWGQLFGGGAGKAAGGSLGSVGGSLFKKK